MFVCYLLVSAVYNLQKGGTGSAVHTSGIVQQAVGLWPHGKDLAYTATSRRRRRCHRTFFAAQSKLVSFSLLSRGIVDMQER